MHVDPRYANHLQCFSLSDDPGSSLARAVAELFENSIDAGASRVDVTLEQLAGDASRFRVRVTDDGHGFGTSDLDRITELFSSSKGFLDEGGRASSGCFGIGLKCLLLWSHISRDANVGASGVVEIRTTTREALDVTTLSVRLAEPEGVADGAGGQPLALHPILHHVHHAKPADAPPFSGTAVSATLCGSNAGLATLRRAFATAQALLTATPLDVTFRLPSSPPLSLSLAPTPINQIYNADVRNASASAPPTLAGVRAFLASLAAAAAHDGADSERWLHVVGEGVGVVTTRTVVHVTVLLAAAASVADGAHPEGAKQAAALIDLRANTVLFLNNKRVGDDAGGAGGAGSGGGAGGSDGGAGGGGTSVLRACCASLAGLRRARWKQHGASLHASRAAVAFDAPHVRGLWLVIHTRSAADPTVRFGDLGKTWVTPSRPLERAIGAAVDAALGACLTHLAALGAPLGKRDRQRAEERALAEAVAKSIAGIVCASRDEAVVREGVRALGLEERIFRDRAGAGAAGLAEGRGAAGACSGGVGAAADDDTLMSASPPPLPPPAELMAEVEPALLKHLLRDWSVLWSEPTPDAPTAKKPSRRVMRRGSGQGSAEEAGEEAEAEEAMMGAGEGVESEFEPTGGGGDGDCHGAVLKPPPAPGVSAERRGGRKKAAPVVVDEEDGWLELDMDDVW